MQPSEPKPVTTTSSTPVVESDRPLLAGSTPSPLKIEIVGQPASGSDDKTVIRQRPLGTDPSPPITTSLQQLGQSLIGKRLEHYDLVEFVGGGGMGAVFRAIDTRLGRSVAVKVLSRDHSDEDTIRRFRNEAQSAARLDHPNIARVHYVGEDHGWNFIVFEFIDGVNLRDMVERAGPLTLSDALNYTHQVAEALAHSSSRDVVHRDIKPSNVLVTPDGMVKLVDMGLARLHQVESSSEDLTASGVTLGTFDYISPEQARDPRAADVRSDIYSLGCTLYYVLTGRPPFPDGTALQKLLRHNADEPPDVRVLRPELSPSVSALLAKMLAKRPSQRHQTAAELAGEIAALAAQLGLSDVIRRGQIPTAPQRADSHLLWQVAAAIVALVAILWGLETVFSRTSPQDDIVLRPKLLLPALPNEGATAAEPASSGNSTVARAAVGPPPDRPYAPTSPVAGASTTGVSATPSTSGGTAAPASNLDSDSAVGIADGVSGAALPANGLAVLAPPLDSIAIGPPGEGPLAIIGPPTTPAAPVNKIKRLVVAAQRPVDAPADTEYQTSLAAACLRAAELGLSEIELAWNGPQVEAPLEISQTKLMLRAASSAYRPEIVFRPNVTESISERQMIRFTGGPSSRLTIQGVDLLLALPPEPASGWSLLSLRPGQTLDLLSCVLTVQDGDARQAPVHDRVAMVSVQPRMTADTMSMEPTSAMAANTTILVDGTLARGEATFVSLAEDTPLSLNWTQGLLVTPQRLLTTTGSSSSPKSFDRINLTLENVTAVCREGLFLMDRRRGAGYHFGLDVDASRCIFMTDVDAPLFEYVGVSSVQPNDLQVGGEMNRYPPRPDVTFLRYESPPPDRTETSIDLSDRGTWSRESQPRPLDQWRMSPPADRPAHLQTKEAYQPPADVAIEAGFDPSRLPSIHDSAAPAAPAVLSPSRPPVGPPPDVGHSIE
jgi:serine/threonine protein kinase